MIKKLRKEDFQSGMLLEDKDGCFGLVLLNAPEGDVIVGNGNGRETFWRPIVDLNLDHIKRVWGFPNNSLGGSFTLTDRKLIYEKEKPIMISGHEVEFTSNGIKVGCTVISDEQITEIYMKKFAR